MKQPQKAMKQPIFSDLLWPTITVIYVHLIIKTGNYNVHTVYLQEAPYHTGIFAEDDHNDLNVPLSNSAIASN